VNVPLAAHDREIYLIINADDYGYFPSVNRGILDAAREGAITATGIMANGAPLDEHLNALKGVPDLDCGIHLNLTYGDPVTDRMKRHLERWGGIFPGKLSAAAAVLRGFVPLAAVEEEWRAQLVRCVVHGITPAFLNSHEHIHMLPALFSITSKLSREFSIDYVRWSMPDWHPMPGVGGLIRNLALASMSAVRHSRGRQPGQPKLLGVGVSGKLSMAYFERKLPTLKSGQVYELMCHPGYHDPAEIRDPSLTAYHAWEEELSALRSPELSRLFEHYRVRRVRFTQLSTISSQHATDQDRH